jgi:predicted enzyme related to lactoylglutathione lyase
MKDVAMAQVIGIGGVFFKARDPAAWADWHQRVLGIDIQNWGANFGAMFPADALAAKPGAGGVLSAFRADTDHFAPSTAGFMLNLCVDDLVGVLAKAKEAGVEPIAPMVDDDFGKFAHLIDCEGIKVELWEPKGG